MVKYGITGALAFLIASSCGSGPGGPGGRGGTGGGTGGTAGVLCIPGASVSCTCTSGRQGAQVCNADGKGLGACVCSGDSGGAGSGGAGATSGAGGSVGGNGGSAGGTGGTGAPCQGSLPPEIAFGSIGQGDANPSFQSGVGALGTDAMYLFSGFTSAATGGSGGNQRVYVQAFDPRTGVSKGAAQSLFSPPTLGFESATYVGGSVYLFAAAVADTGDIALAYQLINSVTSNAALYVAFLSPSTTSGAGVQGLQLQHVELVSASFVAGASGDQNNPKLFWSNASRTFVLNYATRAAQQPLPQTALQIAVARYNVSGQSAGGISPVPVPSSFSDTPAKAVVANGGVGESGNLLGVQYAGWNGQSGQVTLTTLDQDVKPVGTPAFIALSPRSSWMAVAGTAKGFVCTFFGVQYVNVNFVPTSGSTDGGVAGFSITSLTASTIPDGRAIADDVGTGGKGGVGLALVLPTGSVVFGYVNSDGTAIEGPTQAFADRGAVGAMSMTNFKGRFAISTYDAAAHSARVVTSGVCP